MAVIKPVDLEVHIFFRNARAQKKSREATFLRCARDRYVHITTPSLCRQSSHISDCRRHSQDALEVKRCLDNDN